jgi:hypothetical protein
VCALDRTKCQAGGWLAFGPRKCGWLRALTPIVRARARASTGWKSRPAQVRRHLMRMTRAAQALAVLRALAPEPPEGADIAWEEGHTKPKCPYIALGKKDTISQAPVDAGGATGGAAGKQAAAVVDGGSRSRAKKKRAPSRKKIRSDFLATVLKSVALKQVDYTVKWFEKWEELEQTHGAALTRERQAWMQNEIEEWYWDQVTRGEYERWDKEYPSARAFDDAEDEDEESGLFDGGRDDERDVADLETGQDGEGGGSDGDVERDVEEDDPLFTYPQHVDSGAVGGDICGGSVLQGGDSVAEGPEAQSGDGGSDTEVRNAEMSDRESDEAENPDELEAYMAAMTLAFLRHDAVDEEDERMQED